MWPGRIARFWKGIELGLEPVGLEIADGYRSRGGRSRRILSPTGSRELLECRVAVGLFDSVSSSGIEGKVSDSAADEAAVLVVGNGPFRWCVAPMPMRVGSS